MKTKAEKIYKMYNYTDSMNEAENSKKILNEINVPVIDYLDLHRFKFLNEILPKFIEFWFKEEGNSCEEMLEFLRTQNMEIYKKLPRVEKVMVQPEVASETLNILREQLT